MNPVPLVLLFDIDDTLIDNDAMQQQLDEYLIASLGNDAQTRYRQIFEETRVELGYADFLGATERLRMEMLDSAAVMKLGEWLLEFPFVTLLYPGALDAVAHAHDLGFAGILSDGDAVYQPHKIARAGLSEVFGDAQMIFVHKEQELSVVEERFPAEHYVMVDDKVRVLAAMKEIWGDRLTTVSVKQGHYANDPVLEHQYPAADLSLQSISEFSQLGINDLV